jgi:hypothetical protein
MNICIRKSRDDRVMTRKTEQLLEICILKLEKVRILEFMIVEARISLCVLV